MFSLKTIFGLLIFILILHALATVNFWYLRIFWFDMPMHFLGGLWVATVYFYIGFNGRWMKFLTDAIMVLAFVALVGVFWEFFEFVSDFLVESKRSGLFQAGAADTLSDLFFDLLGGAAIFVIYKIKMFNNKVNKIRYLWTIKAKK